MRYNGGKFAVAKDIAEIIAACSSGETYWEPFVGAANVICRPELAHFTRYGSDLDPNIIMLLNAVKGGWVPPTSVTEQEYAEAKLAEPSALRAFIGYGCSFGGKFFGGYARSGTRNYAGNAHRSLLKQADLLRHVALAHSTYRDEPFGKADVIYCDPPYKGTTRCGSASDFDSAAFFEWCIKKAECGSRVFVSEFQAPKEFKKIWDRRITDGLRKSGTSHEMIERLFVCQP